MELTPHQAKYFALELTRLTASDDMQKLVPSHMGAKVDLNPHQVEAALFAFKSPLSSGAILADEVGLGKTIEAGLVISQKWAERKRKILIIVPSNLRKQWYQELSDKFFLPSVILEKRSYDLFINEGLHEPFLQDEIVICSYQFARKHEADIKKIEWECQHLITIFFLFRLPVYCRISVLQIQFFVSPLHFNTTSLSCIFFLTSGACSRDAPVSESRIKNSCLG